MRFYVIANADGEIVSIGSVVAKPEALEAEGLRIVNQYNVETDDTKIAVKNVGELADRLNEEITTAYSRLAAVERRIVALESKPETPGGSYRENP